VISDVADKIIGQFASCVASKLQGEEAPAESSSSEGPITGPTEAPVSAAAGAASSNGSPGSATTATAPAPTTKHVAASTAPMKSEIDAIDLLDTAGAPVVKRLAPVVGGLGLLLLVIFLIRRLRS